MFKRVPRSRDLLKTVLGLFKRGPEQLEIDFRASEREEPEAVGKSEPAEPKTSEKQPEFVRSELNLEQNAVFTVSTYREKSRAVTRTYVTDAGTMERKVVVGEMPDGSQVGVLTTTHFKVYLALLELWEKAGRPVDRPVHFTVLKMLKRLNLVDGGTNYQTVTRALGTLRATPIRFIDSFLNNDGEFKSTGYLSVLSYLDIYEQKRRTKKGNKVYGYGEFKFDDHILMSLAGNFTHPLRLDIITGFTKHRDLAILLYTYLDRQLAFKRKFEIGLTKLYRQLDLSDRYMAYPSQRKGKIEPVLEQITGKELSTGKLSSCVIEKTTDGKDYKLVCRKTGVTQIPEPEPIKLDWGSLSLNQLLGEIEDA